MITTEPDVRTLALDALAGLLAYPDERTGEALRAALASLPAAFPAAARELEPLARAVADTPLHELEELFARTFDWSSDVALEIGWHLFGEQYERGAFLVRMRELLRGAAVEEGPDLPDHLGSCLRLLARVGAEEAAGLARTHVVPATAKIVAGFGAQPNPYAALLRAVAAALDDVAGPATPEGGR